MAVLLPVSDIERLAKAGVTIIMEEVLPQQDPYPAQPQPRSLMTLADAVWERWERSKRARNSQYIDDGMRRPYQLLASQHDDKVWVSVHPTNFVYEPFQLQDHAAIFPSDALMAQLALWEEHHKSGV